jgi:uncharacterized protein
VDGFEWDEEKAAANLAKHGFRFIDVVAVFDVQRSVTMRSDRDGEERYVSVIDLNGRLVTVVWTKRDNRRRIISARRARDNEQRTYRSLYGR